VIITWRELVVNLTGVPSHDLMVHWRWLVPPSLSLRMVSTLGDAFLEDPEGAIHWLDTGGADLVKVAESPDHFHNLRQQTALANRWFSPQLVGDLLSGGHSLEPGQCFSCKIPLTLGGKLHPDNFSPCDLPAHFRALGLIQAQIRDFPVGTRFTSVRIGD
jgi:hypothetical protein